MIDEYLFNDSYENGEDIDFLDEDYVTFIHSLNLQLLDLMDNDDDLIF